MRTSDLLSSTLRPFVALSLGALSLGWMSGCDSGPSCAIDTDCLLGEYCSTSGQCLELGSTGDGGGRDAGGGETGPRDAATDVRIDAPLTDTGAMDVPADVPPTCPDLVGDYAFSSSETPCTAATTMSITGPAPSECAYEVALDGRGAGAVALDGDATFTGTLSLVAGAPETCTITFGDLRDHLTVTCGACVLDAVRMP